MYTLNYQVAPSRKREDNGLPAMAGPDRDADFLRGRQFDFSRKFLPDGLSMIHEPGFLNQQEKRLLSQVQARSHASLSALLHKFIALKLHDISHEKRLAGPAVRQALADFRRDELHLQALYRHAEYLMAKGMPAGYVLLPEVNEVAIVMLEKCSWAVWAFTCHMQASAQAHYLHSTLPDDELCGLSRDMFACHWQVQSRYAALAEDEWFVADRELSATAHEQAVNDLIALLEGMDGMLQAQADADAIYFLVHCGRIFRDEQAQKVRDVILKAYRWQFILAGMQEVQFLTAIGGMISGAQGERIYRALAPMMG